MGVLENGLWLADKSVEQLSHEDTFQGLIEPEEGRYHLYVSQACPFAHRPWLVLQLLGLDNAISVSTVAAIRHDNGWEFSPGAPDPLHHRDYLHSLYVSTDANFTGRVSVPVLWDKHESRIVCNDSAKLATTLATDWMGLAANPYELVPGTHADDITGLSQWLHENINRKVYQAGFATGQADYDSAVDVLFEALAVLEKWLSSSTYLMGDRLTLPDLFLFPTLVRFETVYAVHFKANRMALSDYPMLYRYMLNLLSRSELRETIHMRHILEHYYLSHRHINPFGIIPTGPRPSWVEQYALMT